MCSAASLLLVLAGYLLAVRPKAAEVTRAQADRRAALAQSESLRNDIRQLQAVQANALPLQTRAKDVRSLFPPSPALPDLVNAVQRVADQSGVDLTSVQPSPPVEATDGTGLAQIATTLDVTGGYFQVEDFLSRLEGMVRSPDPASHIPPRSLLVNAVKLTRGGAAEAAAAGPGTAGTGGAATPTTPANPDVLTAEINLVAFEATGKPSGTRATTAAAAPTAGSGSGSGSAPTRPDTQQGR